MTTRESNPTLKKPSAPASLESRPDEQREQETDTHRMPKVPSPERLKAAEGMVQRLLKQNGGRKIRNIPVSGWAPEPGTELGGAYYAITSAKEMEFTRDVDDSLLSILVEGENGPAMLLVQGWVQEVRKTAHSNMAMHDARIEGVAVGTWPSRRSKDQAAQWLNETPQPHLVPVKGETEVWPSPEQLRKMELIKACSVVLEAARHILDGNYGFGTPEKLEEKKKGEARSLVERIAGMIERAEPQFRKMLQDLSDTLVDYLQDVMGPSNALQEIDEIAQQLPSQYQRAGGLTLPRWRDEAYPALQVLRERQPEQDKS